MFDFVSRYGADKNSYLPEFLKWTSLTVSSKVRRLRLGTFTVLNKLNGAGPLASIALCKRSLRMKPTNTMCPAPEASLEKREAWEFKLLEEILFFFHTMTKGAVEANVEECKRLIFYGNVDIAAADAFVSVKQTDVMRRSGLYKRSMVAATAKYWKQISGGGAVPEDRVSTGWASFPEVIAEVASEAAQQSAVADSGPALPTLIRYDESDGSRINDAPALRAIVQAPSERFKLPYIS